MRTNAERVLEILAIAGMLAVMGVLLALLVQQVLKGGFDDENHCCCQENK